MWITDGDMGNACLFIWLTLQAECLKILPRFVKQIVRLSEIQWNLWMKGDKWWSAFPTSLWGLKALRGKQQRKENLRGIPISCLYA